MERKEIEMSRKKSALSEDLENAVDISQEERKVRIHRYEIENKQLNKSWTICCSNSSSDAIKYFTSVAISLLILIFSFVQIIRNTSDSSIYYNFISLIVGIFIKSPSLKNNNELNN